MQNTLESESRGRLFKLLPTLMVWISILVVFTVAVISYIGFSRTKSSIEYLVQKQFLALGQSTQARMLRIFESASETLLEMENDFKRGTVNRRQTKKLGMSLVDKLRLRDQMGWIGYSDIKRNSFIGGHRDKDRTLRYYHAEESIRKGIPVEYVVNNNNEKIKDLPEQSPYLVNTRPFFKLCVASPGLQWMEPYEFTSGEWGISACLGIDSGVLSVDYFLRDLTEYVTRQKIAQSGFVALLTPQGKIIGTNGGEKHKKIVAQIANSSGANRGYRTITHDGNVYRAQLEVLEHKNAPPWKVVIVAPEDEILKVVYQNTREAILAGLVVLMVALFLAYYFSLKISHPIGLISKEMSKVGNFQLEPTVLPNSIVKEVAQLSDSLHVMKSGLQSFSHYVPLNVVRKVIESKSVAKLDGERAKLTIFFSDLEGFTEFSEKLTPEEVVNELQWYFEMMVDNINAQHGTIDKFMGDGILSFFGAPEPISLDAEKACQAALDSKADLARIMDQKNMQHNPFVTRIGLAKGEVLVGNIGTRQQFAYTVIGDTVNLASRLEALNKYYGTLILANEQVFKEAKDKFLWRKLDRVSVYGKSEVTDIYELVSYREKATEKEMAKVKSFEEALESYLEGQFEKAKAEFDQLGKEFPEDLSIQRYMERIEILLSEPPGNWNGIWSHTSK